MPRHWSTVAWLSAVFGCAAIDAAARTIAVAAFGATCIRAEYLDAVVERHAAVVGRAGMWCLVFGVAFSGNAIACAAAFLMGKALAAVRVGASCARPSNSRDGKAYTPSGTFVLRHSRGAQGERLMRGSRSQGRSERSPLKLRHNRLGAMAGEVKRVGRQERAEAPIEVLRLIAQQRTRVDDKLR